MKKAFKVSIVTMMALSSLSYAGGDLRPITEFEMNDSMEAVKAVEVELPKVVAPIVKEDAPWYVGLGLTAGEVDNGNCQDKTYGLMAKAGYDFNEYVGVEVRGLKTNWDYEGAKIEHIGAFLKPQYPITEDINLYGLLGYAKTQVEKRYVLDENGLAFGAGIDYDFGSADAFSIFADYERLLQKSNMPDLDALSLGLAYKF